MPGPRKIIKRNLIFSVARELANQLAVDNNKTYAVYKNKTNSKFYVAEGFQGTNLHHWIARP